MMMQTVASHKAENRMSSSAVAACMAPLLLRPLLAGDCELENDFDVGGDGSAQLLQAAAAANHAQAIVITLLEEYDKIFGVSSNFMYLYFGTSALSVCLSLQVRKLSNMHIIFAVNNDLHCTSNSNPALINSQIIMYHNKLPSQRSFLQLQFSPVST